MLMPGMDGFEVLQKIRAFSAVPVIATSRLLESRERAIALGANAFAEKPFNLDALISLIRITLETGADTAPPS
jgi:two-component system KDP operon response regulator KdpE